MANNKKVTEKSTVKKTVEAVANAEPTVAEPVVVETTVKAKKEFKDSDYITCRSVWAGGLSITTKFGGYYEFNGYSAECDIEYRDLVYLIRKNSDHIFTPRFIITDEDFLEEFPRVKKLYASMYSATELHEIIDLPIGQMKTEIEKLPEDTKATLSSMIATDIANGRLDSIKKVKALSEIFNSDFNLLSELFSR